MERSGMKSKLIWLLCFFRGHQWYYAKGRSVAQDITGSGKRRTRPSCVRRQCKSCGKKQQINRFTDLLVVDGDYFNGKPEWIDGHET